MTDAQRITLTGALRLLLQRHEYAIRARLDLDQAQHEGELAYPGTIERKAMALARAEFTLDAAVDQFIEVLEHSLEPHTTEVPQS